MSSQDDAANGRAGNVSASFGTEFGAAPSHVTDTSTATFRQDVLNESTRQPVLVDFWAPWCGPCKQLGPLIEKVVKAANGKVKLVKMDIEAYPEIAGQLGIQSIPAVIAFSNGQPVDGFVGALPESQIRGFIERLVGPIGPAAVDETLAEAEKLAAEGDAAAAADLYAAVLAEEPENVKALGGLARLQVGLGDLDQAEALLAGVPEAKAGEAAIAGARAALDLARQAETLGDTAELERRIAADPKDYQARFDLALALAGHNRREEAVDQLIDIIRRDRKWQDDGARKQLVQFFEAWGPQDDATADGRRRLSSVLFS
jgi:putative thioredoxin